MASRSWNRVELIGNLTRDPELRYTPNGAAVCTFGIATNRTYVSEGERKEEVDFHRLVAWNKLAELCNQLLKKGNRVFISGRLQNRSWESADGQSKQVTEVVVEDMILLTPKGNGVVTESEDINLDTLPSAGNEPAQTTSTPTSSTTAPSAQNTSDDNGDKPAKERAKEESKSPKEEVEDEDLPF